MMEGVCKRIEQGFNYGILKSEDAGHRESLAVGNGNGNMENRRRKHGKK